MKILYSIGISIYGAFIFIASLFNEKARLLHTGQQDAFKLLKEKVDPDGGYIWFHAASLGEFEQGRPVIEQLKRAQPGSKILLTFFSPSGYEVRKNYAGADIVACAIGVALLANKDIAGEHMLTRIQFNPKALSL